ncbi:uncharacterized protein LOC134292179 [Aedes albopictus]|uniref:Retrovirus-related env polyprotein from transposon gypsy n=1 Tax=Aedes albopictus TaxID=7160 RepID=A0ABM1XSY8_AEDAL
MTDSINVLISKFNNFSTEFTEGFSSVNLLFIIDELTQQIKTIGEAIILARFSIPSIRLIGLTELTVAQNFLKDQGLNIATAKSVLEIARAYVVTTKDSIKYILRVPKVTNEIYTLYQVEAAISNGTRVHLDTNFYLNGTAPYSTKSVSDSYADQFICQSSQLESPSKCVQKFMGGSSAHCPMEKVCSRNIVKRINDGKIIVQDADIMLKSNCSLHRNKLEGSYLIQFSECTILLDGERFININVDIPGKTFIPTTGLKVNFTNVIDRIPPEHLQILHMMHREHIQHLNVTSESIQGRIHLLHWLSFGSISVTTLAIIGVALDCIIRTLLTRKASATINQNQHETITEAKETSSDKSTQKMSVSYPTRQPRFIPQ